MLEALGFVVIKRFNFNVSNLIKQIIKVVIQ